MWPQMLTNPCVGAVKKYFVKIYKKKKQKKSKKIKKLDKSQTWKGDLDKNERLGGPKTQKGGPGKNQRHEQK